MTETDKLNERFNNEPEFRSLVQTLYGFVERANFTPAELREAAFYASLRFEMYNTQRYVMPAVTDM